MAQRRTFSVDPDYVNIHGHQVTAFISEDTGEIAVALEDVQKMGFSVLRKCYYNKFCIDQSQFDKEFFKYMLNSAKKYMFEQSINFDESKILESINKVKRILLGDDNESVIGSPPTNHSQPQNSTINCRVSLFDNDFKQITNMREPHLRPLARSNKNYQNKGFPNNKDSESSPNNSNNHCNGSGNKNFKSVSDYVSSENGFRKNKFSPRRTQANEQNGVRDSFSEDSTERLLPRLQHIEFTKSEHHVIVSHIEKSADFMWVQDLDRTDVLLSIDEKVRLESDGPVLKTRLNLNTVYLAKDDEDWFRCKIIKFKPLTVFFIDYGNTAEITEVKGVSEELSKIPCQCVKVKLISQPKPKYQDNIRIHITDREPNGTYIVEIINQKKEETPPPPTTPKIKTYFTKPSPLCKLEDGQQIMIIGQHSGKLAVRTKECALKLKEIEGSLDKIESTESLESVQIGQLVLYNKENKLKRAIVTDVNDKNKVELELIDYWEKTKVELKTLRNINESLAKEPVSFVITPKLKGYSSIFNKSIEEAIKLRTKYHVILDFNEFDLKKDDELFSMKYKPIEKSSDRPMLKNFLWFQPQVGLGEYYLNSYINTNKLTFADGTFLNDNIDFLVKSEIDDSDPYEPVEGEVCWGFYEETWYRCAIEKIDGKKYTAVFVDFGNVEVLTPQNLRKYKEDVKAVKIAGIPCKLVGLPRLGNIEELVRRNIKDSETYEIDIKRYKEDAYEIAIPSLQDELTN